MLKEAGWEKPAQFATEVEMKHGVYPICHCELDEGEHYAPLATELLEELPYRIELKGEWVFLEIAKDHKGEWGVYYTSTPKHAFLNFDNKSLPNALAECWIYLKKNNLILWTTKKY